MQTLWSAGSLSVGLANSLLRQHRSGCNYRFDSQRFFPINGISADVAAGTG